MPDDTLFGTDLRDYLTGGWHLTRQIEDRRAGQRLSFSGIARFDANAPAALLYSETGTLNTGHGGAVEATQRHRWTFTDDGAAVAFADGRPFHRVTLEGQHAADLHQCPPDLYHVTYDFNAPDEWHAIWTVHGPRKDYTLNSRYTRLHPGDHPVQCPAN